MNDIYNYGGKDVIERLVGSTTNYIYTKDTYEKSNFDVNGYYRGTLYLGNIFMKGNDYSSQLESVAHESFHALQDEEGQGGASIFNELEAYVFGYCINMNWIQFSNTDMIQSQSSSGEGLDNYWGNIYSRTFKQLSERYNDSTMLLGVISFKKGARPNMLGLYDKFPLFNNTANQRLLKKYFPKYEDK